MLSTLVTIIDISMNFTTFFKLGYHHHDTPYIPSAVQGVHRGDGTYVHPLLYIEGPGDMPLIMPLCKICPYQDCSVEVQACAVRELQGWLGKRHKQDRKDAGAADKPYKPYKPDRPITDDWIKSTWPGGTDIMYVACMPVASNASNASNACDDITYDFIGCIAIDCNNFDPFISHLCVQRDLRRFGWGKRLLRFGIDACRLSLRSSMARLWCTDELVPYYVKQGWWKEMLDDGTAIARHRHKRNVNVMCRDTAVAMTNVVPVHGDDDINAILSSIVV